MTVDAEDRTTDQARVHRRAICVLVTGQVLGGVGIGAAVSVGGLIAEQLSGSPSWAGTATTALTLGAAIFAVPLAGLAARRGRRIGLGAGLAIALLGATVAVASAAAGIFVTYLVGMLAFGAGNATNLQMRFAATDLAPASTRGRDLSVVIWASTIGGVAGPNLTGPGAVVARTFGLPELAGPLLFSAVAFTLGVLTILTLLRPDPLLLAQRLSEKRGDTPPGGNPAVTTQPATPERPQRLRAVLGVVLRTPPARFAFVAIAVSHAVMVSVMAMSPVHMMGHAHAQLSIVGLAISLHVAGMYAFSPIVGWLADRFGRVRTALAGQLILLLSVIIGALGQANSASVTVGLIFLGLGWSFALVSASTLLAESLDQRTRVRAAGLSDLSMNLAGASGGALAGLVLSLVGYAGLNIGAGLVTLPVLWLGARLLLKRQ